MRTKTCTKCKIEKKLSAFNKCKSKKDGLQGWCKSCLSDYRENNKERLRKYYKANRDQIRVCQKRWEKKQYYTNPKFRLDNKMAICFWRAMKDGSPGKNLKKLVGYTKEELKRRLQSTILDGYSWNDYLEGRLHLDHIIPRSKFNYSKPEHIDFKRCWALNNLRLLSAPKNRAKGYKTDGVFQSSLKI